VAHNRRFEAITGSIWDSHYLHRKAAENELLAPLPDAPVAGEGKAAGEREGPEELVPALRSEGAGVRVSS
jgi:hypothetical protein